MQAVIKAALLAVVLAASAAAAAADRVVRLSVPDMNCPACPVTVSKSLERVPGVAVLVVDLKTKTAEVMVHNEAVTDAALMEATNKAGYPSTVAEESGP